MATSGMIGPEAFLVDRERAAQQRLGLGKPVRGLKQQRQVVEVSGHVWMIRAEALLVDGERAAHQRLGLGKTVRGLKQLARLLRRMQRSDDRAEACSSISSARRINGSASASRFVA